jgi:hypothetical protein
MILNMISQYIHTLFKESRNGELTIGSDIERMNYAVEWDEQTAHTLAKQCDALVSHLTELAKQSNSHHLNTEQAEIWNTYLRPFPEHDMDMEALRAIWEKEAIGIMLNREEQQLSRQYNRWYEEQSLTRLPWKGCAPTDVICSARRYARLVQLNAPSALQDHEARRFAEEFVLYHCMK